MRVHYGIKWDMQAFSFLRQSNQLIFVLDGLDEMAAKADLTAVNENIREIVDLASGKSALVVTCRTHFFKSIVDESKLTVFRTVYLLPWRRQELIKYLRKRFGNEYVDVLRKIDNVFNLEELAQTPIFLDMIVETLPAIEDSKKPINSPDLYEHYTQRWITKQEIRRGSVLSHEDKETLMEVLAYEMLTRDELRIDYRELNTVLTDVLEVDRSFLTAVSNDIRTCTFLVRDGNYYRFSHTSFMEFFVARKYFKEILRGEVADFGKVYFKKEVFFFLLGMLRRYQDQGVDKLQKFLNACPVYRSRARIHTVFLLGDIGTSKAEQALWDVLKNDLHSRVSGHAAEALYRKYGRKDAFKVFIDLLKKEPYPREISLPKEPNIGWYSVGGSRKFSVDNSTTISFFIGALNDPICDDQNLKWYAASVLSRIENIEAYIAEDDLRVLADILKKDKLPRVRAYAATIIGNLGFADDWIVNALEFAISQDDDISVRKASETALNLLSDKTR
jgi:hypothetical protein